jgi:hypothetical protein
MLVPIKGWFDSTATLLPENCNFKLDLLRRGVEELQKLGVGFQRLPAATPANIHYALGKIQHDVTDAFREQGCENWVKTIHRRIGNLREALKAEGII